MGRFLTRDVWEGSAQSPLSYNMWNYVLSNPINFIDPSGLKPFCPAGWTPQAVRWRVDVAEKFVNQTFDPMDTYTAAGIAIQCAGTNINRSLHYSGEGIAQVTDKQAETEWGQPIYEYDFWTGKQKYEENDEGIIYVNGKPVPIIRGYGLRLLCPDGTLEHILDQNDSKNAVILMKRQLQLVIDACGSQCTDTDKFIAAALAQNGPGFTYVDLQQLRKLSTQNRAKYGNPGVFKDWIFKFESDSQDGDMVNTKTQLNRFMLITNELRKRKWILPDIDTKFVDVLRNW